MTGPESPKLREDQRSSHFTKIILVAWLAIVGWNSDEIFDPVDNAPAEQLEPISDTPVSPSEASVPGTVDILDVNDLGHDDIVRFVNDASLA